jgi:uncharacterized protein (TIGR02271 family)
VQDQPLKQPKNTTATRDAETHEPDDTFVARHEDELVIPVVAEEVAVETIRVPRGTVRVNTRIETRDETVEIPLEHEEVIVERVPIDRLVDGAVPAPRQENDVLIIPVTEEIAVVEKRLMLREEVRISRRRTATTSRETVTLRREVADVERVDSDPQTPTATTGTIPRRDVDPD